MGGSRGRPTDGRPTSGVSPGDERAEDEALVDELIDDGWIDVTEDGLLTAVAVPRPVVTIAVAFALDAVDQARVSVNRTATFTDRQYVVTTEACRRTRAKPRTCSAPWVSVWRSSTTPARWT